MERLPHGRHHQHDPRPSRSPRRGPSRQPVAFWTRSTVVAGTLALAGVLLPAGMAGATPATTASAPRSLKATLAEINKLSYQISVLGEQYDALKIQLTQARREVKIANETARRDDKLLETGQAALGQIAAAGYMSGGTSPDAARCSRPATRSSTWTRRRSCSSSSRRPATRSPGVRGPVGRGRARAAATPGGGQGRPAAVGDAQEGRPDAGQGERPQRARPSSRPWASTSAPATYPCFRCTATRSRPRRSEGRDQDRRLVPVGRGRAERV